MPTLTFQIHPYALRFREPFVTAGLIHRIRRGYLLQLHWQATESTPAIEGWGEAAPMPGHGGETAEEALDALEQLLEVLTRWIHADGAGLPETPAQLAELAGRLGELAPLAPAARSAVDLALADLAAQRSRLPLANWLHPSALDRLPVNATLGASDADTAVRQAVSAVAAGYGTLKLKLGAAPQQVAGTADLERVSAVRAAVGPDVRLRCDANGAWDEAQAIAMLRALEPYDLEYVEQPVAATDIPALARVRRASPVLVAADESVSLPGGLEAVLEQEAADLLILKPALMGGPSEAMAAARSAFEQGVPCVVTTALDSAVGRWGAVHVAAAVVGLGRGYGMAEYASGLATGGLLAEDVGEGPVVVGGEVVVGERASKTIHTGHPVKTSVSW